MVELVVDGFRHGGKQLVLRAEIVTGKTAAVAGALARLGERQPIDALFGDDPGGGGQHPAFGLGAPFSLGPPAADGDGLGGGGRLPFCPQGLPRHGAHPVAPSSYYLLACKQITF